MTQTQEKSLEAENAFLLERRLERFNSRQGPRVGDFLQLPKLHPKLEDITRFTHDWGDSIQTGGTRGASYYLSGDGFMSYSGGLDRGVETKFIGKQIAERLGSCWFFSGDVRRAHNGVTFQVPCRVFELLPGADLSNFSELESGFWLCVCDDEQRKRHGYRYTISRRAINQTAFDSVNGLVEWSRKEELSLPSDLFAPGHHRLEYTPISLPS